MALARITPVSAAAEGRRLHAEVMRPRPRRSHPRSSAPEPASRPPSARQCEALWPRGSVAALPSGSRLPLHTPGGPARELPNSSPPAPRPPYSASFATPGLLQACLLQDRVQRARRHVQARLPGHCNRTRLVRVLVLAVAATRPRQPPSILLEQPHQFADLHSSADVNAHCPYNV